jgi:hypothetical protein
VTVDVLTLKKKFNHLQLLEVYFCTESCNSLIGTALIIFHLDLTTPLDDRAWISETTGSASFTQTYISNAATPADDAVIWPKKKLYLASLKVEMPR